jgi:hypothetical protein
MNEKSHKNKILYYLTEKSDQLMKLKSLRLNISI